MLSSFAFIFLTGLFTGEMFKKIKLPKIIGMLFAGVIIGPYVLNLLDINILNISGDLRKTALIIILIKAGLSLDLSDLKKVGRPAVLLSFLPALFEIAAYTLFAPLLLGISRVDAALMGAVMGAVSPAVVVPRMVYFIENKWGTKKSIPQMIMAGASCDDIFVIVLFTTFLGMSMGNRADFLSFINIPVSIFSGIMIGALFGYFLNLLFETAYKMNNKIRNSIKVIVILGSSFLLISIENWFENKIAVSGLLAVVSMACVLKIKSADMVSKRLSEKFGKLWLAAELVLFVLVGAAVDIRYTLDAGLYAVLLILISLIFRMFGVLICVIKTKLTFKERMFCVLAYLPKATVQAAIGGVPLAFGLDCGKIILSVAVTGIIITAPIGAFCIDIFYKKLLNNDMTNI